MKNNKFIIITVILVIVIVIFIKEIIPTINESKIKNRVFNDMQTKSDEVIRGIVGIIPEDNNNHNGIGSGVIFDKKDNTYYVVTAKHVIDNENSNFKIFTKDTKYSGQIINADDNVNFEIPDEEYYKSLLDTKIEYISDTTDLAILSFEYNGDLSVLEFENNKLSINDKIMVIGHPEGNRNQISYGYIKSNLKDVKGDKVIEHDAYMKQGNSGGVALTENNKIAGINKNLAKLLIKEEKQNIGTYFLNENNIKLNNIYNNEEIINKHKKEIARYEFMQTKEWERVKKIKNAFRKITFRKNIQEYKLDNDKLMNNKLNKAYRKISNIKRKK